MRANGVAPPATDSTADARRRYSIDAAVPMSPSTRERLPIPKLRFTGRPLAGAGLRETPRARRPGLGRPGEGVRRLRRGDGERHREDPDLARRRVVPRA